MSVQLGFGNLNEDIAFLAKNEKNRFADVSIDEVTQLIQHKKIYKDQFKDSQEYQALKEKMKLLKMAKLPFRIIEMVNDNWKDGKELPWQVNDSAKVKSGRLESQQRKDQKRALRESLVAKAKQHEEALRLVEQINFLHGTNSAILPMIGDTLEMIPSGRLLDAGRAPMGGEIERGGMNTIGANQHSLSADTIRNISRCWDYASETSNSFDPSEYADTEELFLGSLNKLTKSNPESYDWDPLIVKLLRLKQWDPDAFEKLCEDHKEEVDSCKEAVKGSCLTHNEKMIQKVIHYDMDRLLEAKRQVNIPEYFKEEFGIWFAPVPWGIEMKETDFPLYEILTTRFETLLGFTSLPAWHCLLLKMFAKEELQKLQSDSSSVDPEVRPLLVKKLKKTCLGSENAEFTDSDIPLIFEKLVAEKLEATVNRKMASFQRRYNRLLTLFDSKPSIRFRQADREMIEKPFEILFASTKSKASAFAVDSEVNFTKAKLGEDIDLVFVKEENMEKMERWVSDHDLSGRAKVLDCAMITELKGIPLYHAPDQVKVSSFLFKYKLSQLSKLLNGSVFPLYRTPYHDGGSRFWHGVPHAVRAVLFAQVLVEMAHAKGITFKHDTIGLLLAMALHDVARQNDGKDLWDKESGEKAKEVLMRELKLSEEEGNFFAACIADKDQAHPTSMEQRIIHDGDCIEIMRCLQNPSDFKVVELRMKGILDENSLLDLICEAKLLIELTDKGEVKDFLEKAENPYKALLQMVLYAYKECGMFENLAQYTFHATSFLDMPSEYQLTGEVESAIKEKASTKSL